MTGYTRKPSWITVLNVLKENEFMGETATFKNIFKKIKAKMFIQM